MPIRMVNFLKEPPPPFAGRWGGSPIQQTEEWKDLMLALGNGLKPQEYVTLSLPDTHPIRKKIRHVNAAFLRGLRVKIRKLGLPYDCYERNKVIYIVGRGVIS